MWTEKLAKQYQNLYESAPELIVSAPGRINLIGEHTDYNEGFVMPAAIDKRIYFAIGHNQTQHLKLYAANFSESFIAPVDRDEASEVPWANYFIGVIQEMLKIQSFNVPGINCVFGGDIPDGAGLSSSAALEIGFSYGLNQMLQTGFTEDQLMHLSQMAEHHYVGLECGIMDQFSSMRGKQDQVMQLDCRTLDYEYRPLDLKQYSMVLCNSNVKHSLASSEYNVRRQQCTQGAEFFQKNGYPEVKNLRDVTTDMLERHKNEMDPVVFRRCHHVIHENQRVFETGKALEQGNHEEVGELLYQSHNSLSDKYEVSCEELDFLVDQTRDDQHVAGARMMGGGFGGCTLNLVKTSYIEAFQQKMRERYMQQFNIEPEFYVVNTDDGPRTHERSSSLNE